MPSEEVLNVVIVQQFLLYSLAVNYAFLLIWFLAFIFARDAIFKLHTRWFRLSREQFDSIHYAGLAAFKIGILLLNLAPLIALWLLSHDG